MKPGADSLPETDAPLPPGTPPDADQYAGCLLGLALGDALGAPHEGGPLERALWRLLGTTRAGEARYTDDTQMSLDLAESLLEHGGVDADALALRFAASYRWSRGYGPAAARLLRRIRKGTPWRQANRSVYPDGSLGNGGAMRAPVLGLYFHGQPARLFDAARRTAEITHAHPLGIEGAQIVAAATAAALATRDWRPVLDAAAGVAASAEFAGRLAVARDWLAAGETPPPAEVRKRLGSGITAPQSCVTAVYLGLRFGDLPFDELLAFVAACRGDVDTIGAMAGALWGARNGAARLPAPALARLEGRARIEAVALRLHELAPRSA